MNIYLQGTKTRGVTLNLFFALLCALPPLSGCVDAQSWACRRSSECPNGQFCRIGQCVPAVGFIARSNPQGHSIPDAGNDSQPDSRPDSGSPIVVGCPDGKPPIPGELIVNEVLANVPSGPEGDANADGARDAYDDEFVAIVNRSDHTLDVSGVSLRIENHPKFKFTATCLKSKQAAVIYGGGEPTLRANILIRVADARLSLSNQGGRVDLLGADGTPLDSMRYTDSPDEALTRAPQLSGTQFVAHSQLAAELRFSPGTCPRGASFSQECDL